MQVHADGSIIDNIMQLAHEIIDECPSCSGKASEIIIWAEQIRERRPSREELTAFVDAASQGALSNEQRTLMINGLTAFVRFAE